MKTKYAIPKDLVDDLVKSGMVQDEESALEKVASGEALDALLQRKEAQLAGLEPEFAHVDSRGVILESSIDSTKASIKELKYLIEQRDAPSEV